MLCWWYFLWQITWSFISRELVWSDRMFSNSKIYFFSFSFGNWKSSFHWLLRGWPEHHRNKHSHCGYHWFPTKRPIVYKKQTDQNATEHKLLSAKAPRWGQEQNHQHYTSTRRTLKNIKRKIFCLFSPFFLEFFFFFMIAVHVQWWQALIMANPCQSWEVSI